MYEEELKKLSDKMDKSIVALKNEFTSIRTGRANASLLDRVFVEYYGSRTPITQVASVTVPGSSSARCPAMGQGSSERYRKSLLGIFSASYR